MLRGSGFEVIDLGVDTSPDDFIEAVEEHQPQLLGMSALLTTTMPNMGRTIEAFIDAGLRDDGQDHGRRRAGDPGVRRRHGRRRLRQGRGGLRGARQGSSSRCRQLVPDSEPDTRRRGQRGSTRPTTRRASTASTRALRRMMEHGRRAVDAPLPVQERSTSARRSSAAATSASRRGPGGLRCCGGDDKTRLPQRLGDRRLMAARSRPASPGRTLFDDADDSRSASRPRAGGRAAATSASSRSRRAPSASPRPEPEAFLRAAYRLACQAAVIEPDAIVEFASCARRLRIVAPDGERAGRRRSIRSSTRRRRRRPRRRRRRSDRVRRGVYGLADRRRHDDGRVRARRPRDGPGRRAGRRSRTRSASAAATS